MTHPLLGSPQPGPPPPDPPGSAPPSIAGLPVRGSGRYSPSRRCPGGQGGGARRAPHPPRAPSLLRLRARAARVDPDSAPQQSDVGPRSTPSRPELDPRSTPRSTRTRPQIDHRFRVALSTEDAEGAGSSLADAKVRSAGLVPEKGRPDLGVERFSVFAGCEVDQSFLVRPCSSKRIRMIERRVGPGIIHSIL